MEQSAMKMGAMGSDNRTWGNPALDVGGEVPNGDSLEQIYQSARTLCRTLRKSPAAMDVLYGFASQEPRQQSVLLFNQYLSDLTGIMYRRLSTTVEEEAANRHRLHELTECEKLAEDERDTLQQTLDATRTEKEREVGVLEATIKRLREELQEVTQSNAIEMESINNRAGEAMAKAKEDHEKKVTRFRGKPAETVKMLMERVDRLTGETMEVSETHRNEEASARKKKAKAEAELAATIAKYDKDMMERTEEIREVEAKMRDERTDLATLTEHFDRVDANSRQRDSEEERLAAVGERVAKAMGALDRAVTSIQAAYRGNIQRAEYLKAKKKAKKGLGLGRGKKGGKKKGKK